MSQDLNDLAPVFYPLACRLVAHAVNAGIQIQIINTRRTAAEQAVNVATGASSVTHSKHQDGLAIDVCPYAIYLEVGPDKLNWNDTDPNWVKLGVIGEGLGLRWGGRWTTPHDPGHFEYVAPAMPPPGTPTGKLA